MTDPWLMAALMLKPIIWGGAYGYRMWRSGRPKPTPAPDTGRSTP